MATINYSTADRITSARSHRVYTRAAWAAGWTFRNDIACVQCVWNAAPDRSTATLVRDYGRTLQPGSTLLANLTPIALEGNFVLIEWDADEAIGGVPIVNYWLGIVDSSSDAADGPSDGVIPASGRQSFICYGMERLLQVAPIVDTVWRDGTESKRTGGATAFNAGGSPNRSDAIIGGETYAFEADRSAAKFWSTRDIINHLLFYHLPTNTGGVASIPWALGNVAIVPDWDTPEIEVEGLSIYDLLNRLLDSRLLLGWAAGFNNTSLAVAPFSLAGSTITLDDKTFPANGTQHAFIFGSDPLTSAEISTDNSDRVDQVIVRGARRVSVCTLRSDDSDLEAGWTVTEKNEYNTAASALYGTLDLVDQRYANKNTRRSSLYDDVFSLMMVPDDFDWTVKNGADTEPVFDPISGVDPHVPFRNLVEVLPSLPIGKGRDYSGDIADRIGERIDSFRLPFVTLSRGVGEYVDTSRIGESLKVAPSTGETIDYTIRIQTSADELGLRLIVEGNEQHLIGGLEYTPLPADEIGAAHFGILTASATLALTDDRFCEVTEPASVGVADVVRRRVFHVGDAYQQVYIVPGTVVDVSSVNYTEKKSNGGYLRDDRQKLTYLAKLLASYHSAPRVSMSLNSYRRTSLASVGDMVATADGASVYAVIKRIQIDAPLGDGNTTPRPTQQIVATASTVDLIATLAIASRS